MFKYFLFFILGLTNRVLAENTYRFDIYGSAAHQKWNNDSNYNSDNRYFEVPDLTYTLELRPDLEFKFSEKHSAVIRSRHFLQAFETKYKSPDETNYSSDSESELSDLFFSSYWNDAFFTTVGLQNYQWGPAEIFSPSNPFFHFDYNQRSFFYKEKGRVLVRANWNPNSETSNWSVVGIYEPINNQTSFWIADKDFKPRSAIKIEYQAANPANAVSLIAGQGEDQKGFIGEYFTWSPVDGTSFYGDIQQRKGRVHYTPERNSLTLYDLVEESSDQVFTLAVFGFRWEGRVDFRQEFIWNEAGYNDEEWQRARASAITLSPNLLTNARRFVSPGLEFRTQKYSYTSLRVPDLGRTKRASFAARWLSSMDHYSSVLQLNMEYNWNDNTVLSLENLEFFGNDNSEFRLLVDRQTSVGFRWSH